MDKSSTLLDVLFPGVMRHLPADEAAWQEHDARVQAQRDAELAEQERERVTRMVERLAAQGCPRSHLDKATSRAPWPRFDESMPAVRALHRIEAQTAGVRFLAGPPGVGKTLAGIHWALHHGGRRPAFIRMADFIARPPWDNELRELWQTASTLVLDDLGTGAEETDERALEKLRPRLDDLLDHFTQSSAVLIVTTNLSGNAFKSRYGTPRLNSRLAAIRQAWAVVEGDDLRRTGGQR